MNLKKSLKSIKYVTAAILSTGLIFNTAFMFNTRITAWFTKEFYDKMKVEYKDCKAIEYLLNLAQRLQTCPWRAEIITILLNKVDPKFKSSSYGNYLDEDYKKQDGNVKSAIKSLLSANEELKQQIFKSYDILKEQNLSQFDHDSALNDIHKASSKCNVQKETLHDAENQLIYIVRNLFDQMLIATNNLNKALTDINRNLSDTQLIMCLLLNTLFMMEKDGQFYGKQCINKIKESNDHNACQQFLKELEESLLKEIKEITDLTQNVYDY